MMLSVVVAILYTSIHNVVYNWVYLPRHRPLPMLITWEIVVGYWNWIPGRVLIIINLLLILLPFVLWFWVKYSVAARQGD